MMTVASCETTKAAKRSPPDRLAPRFVAARRHFFAIDARRGAEPNQEREMSTASGPKILMLDIEVPGVAYAPRCAVVNRHSTNGTNPEAVQTCSRR
jgi:hypothetical protein